MRANASALIEVSYEVCNKVGGIHTVVSSKAAAIKEKYENYILVGPYVRESADVEFEALAAPAHIQKAIDVVRRFGVTAHYGKWLIRGEPTAILLEFWPLADRLDTLKKELWEHFGVDSLYAGPDFDEPLLLSHAAALLIQAIKEHAGFSSLVVQSHEWMTGMTGLFLKQWGVDVGTVFTTHATMLGRSISSTGEDLYGMLDTMNPEKEAYNRGVAEKFTTERACAQYSDVFTTVSQITGMETEKILGRKPDVLTLNGLDARHFPSFEQISSRHEKNRERIHEFLNYYFSPYYTFDSSHCLHYFVSGRYEFRNKGMDITIKALGRLNEELKKSGRNRTVACFFFVPMRQYGVRKEVIENKVYYRNIKHFVKRNFSDVQNSIVQEIAHGNPFDTCQILPRELEQASKRLGNVFRRTTDRAPLSTHYVDEDDATMQAFQENGLLNRKEDKVKVILYPVYLSGADGLLDMEYYEAVLGCHLGVFPSYYEPWGYTPMETAMLGVASVTSDLSGFGRFIEAHEHKDFYPGVFVIKRYGKPYDQSVDQCMEVLWRYAMFEHNERVENKISAKHLSRLADWSFLVTNYISAHNMALEKK